MILLLFYILFLKEFLGYNGCFGLFTKIKKEGLGIVFGVHFLHDYPYKYSLFNTLSMDKVSYLFSFSGHQTKCVMKFLFRQLMTS